MAEAKEAQEPSMEEILASIRRIISDEDSPDEQEPAPEPEEDAPMEDGVEMSQDDLDALFDSPSPAEEPDEPEEEEEELSMEEAMAQEAEEEPEPEPEADLSEPEIVEGLDPDDADISFAVDDGEDDDDGPPLDLGPEFEVTEPEPAHQYQAIPDSPLGSSEDLAEALLSPTTDAVVSSAFGSLAHTILSKNARTLEDLVGELLRPMLKSWLDANLPGIVERLVRKEIERVTRNGGEQ